MTVDRRRFLQFAATAVPMVSVASRMRAESRTIPGRLTRMRSPVNLEVNFASLDGFVTPNNLFYVRNHFTQPLERDPDRRNHMITHVLPVEIEIK